MSNWYLLLARLADGNFHSGEQLAAAQGITRAAVWKRLQRIAQLPGVRIDAVRGRGYRLREPLELLTIEAIRGAMNPVVWARIAQVHVLPVAGSTNAEAAAHPPVLSGCPLAWFAEHQTAGRGRRGREWVSVFGRNIYLSLAWRFDLPMAGLAGLSLVAGLALAESLTELGLHGHGLKWPNDVLFEGRKLAGILVEAFGEADGPAVAVIGIGLNLNLPAEQGAAIEQPWTDLTRTGLTELSRNVIAGRVLERLVERCDAYTVTGLEGCLDAWRGYDLFNGRAVRLLSGPREIRGICRGIAGDGGLVLDTAEGRQVHHAGEVSLREVGGA